MSRKDENKINEKEAGNGPFNKPWWSFEQKFQPSTKHQLLILMNKGRLV